jgi:perosamine synthetase
MYGVPIHLMPYYQQLYGYKKGDFPITEKLFREEVTLNPDEVLAQEYLFPTVKSIKNFFTIK